MLGNKILFVTREREEYQLSRNDILCFVQCDHKESKARMILHARHSGLTHNHIVVYSPDTDVYILEE